MIYRRRETLPTSSCNTSVERHGPARNARIESRSRAQSLTPTPVMRRRYSVVFEPAGQRRSVRHPNANSSSPSRRAPSSMVVERGHRPRPARRVYTSSTSRSGSNDSTDSTTSTSSTASYERHRPQRLDRRRSQSELRDLEWGFTRGVGQRRMVDADKERRNGPGGSLNVERSSDRGRTMYREGQGGSRRPQYQWGEELWPAMRAREDRVRTSEYGSRPSASRERRSVRFE